MLRRSPFKPKASAPAPRRDRSEEFASVVVERPAARMATGMGDAAPAVRPVLKLPRQVRTRQDIRDAAKGEECTVRIVGACIGGTETTVGAHWPGLDGDRGMGLKASDLCIAFACFGCHEVIDGRAPLPPGASRTSVELDYHHGHYRTLVRLQQRRLL